MYQTGFRFKKVPFQVLSNFACHVLTCLVLSFLILSCGDPDHGIPGPMYVAGAPTTYNHNWFSVQKPRLKSRVGSQITKLVALSSLTRFNLFKFH